MLVAIVTIAIIIAIVFSVKNNNNSSGDDILTEEEKAAIEETLLKDVRAIPETEKRAIEKAFTSPQGSTSAAAGTGQSGGLSAEERAKIEKNLSR